MMVAGTSDASIASCEILAAIVFAFLVLAVLFHVHGRCFKAFQRNTTHTRRQRPKTMIEKKIGKHKKINYDELCPKNNKYEKLGCLIFFDFCRRLPDFFLAVLPGTCRESEKLERYKRNTRIFWFDDLSGV